MAEVTFQQLVAARKRRQRVMTILACDPHRWHSTVEVHAKLSSLLSLAQVRQDLDKAWELGLVQRKRVPARKPGDPRALYASLAARPLPRTHHHAPPNAVGRNP